MILVSSKLQAFSPKMTFSPTFTKHLPILQWLPGYSLIFFRYDLIAGITLASFVLPESIEVDATVAGIEVVDQASAAIRFLPEGGATGGTVAITRKSGGGTRITVDWLSGQLTQQALQP